MDIITNPGKYYRRYRRENPYDKTLLFFVIDTCISLTKLILLLAVLAAAWVVSKRLPDNKPIEQSTTTVQASSDFDVVTGHTGNADATAQRIVGTNSFRSTDKESIVVAVQGNAREIQQPLLQVSLSSSPQSSGETNDESGQKVFDESWILRLNPASYIIQFGASTDLLALEALVPALDFGGPIAVYPYTQTLSGNPVFGIAAGVYKNANAALAAMEYFSEQAGDYEPWIRQAADLTRQIEYIATVLKPQ